MDRLWKYFSFFLDPVVSKLLMPTVHIEHTDKYMQRCSYPRNTALCRVATLEGFLSLIVVGLYKLLKVMPLIPYK